MDVPILIESERLKLNLYYGYSHRPWSEQRELITKDMQDAGHLKENYSWYWPCYLNRWESMIVLCYFFCLNAIDSLIASNEKKKIPLNQI